MKHTQITNIAGLCLAVTLAVSGLSLSGCAGTNQAGSASKEQNTNAQDPDASTQNQDAGAPEDPSQDTQQDTAQQGGTVSDGSEPENTLYQKLESAYIYTLPLMLVDATHTKMTNTAEATSAQAPPNQFIHAQKLADAKARNVVTPNVDTIYSQVMLDLSEDAVVIELPRTDRFCMAQVLDAYTNCISILDAAAFTEPSGTYLFTGKAFTGDIPEGMQQIKCPTDLAWIIIRTVSYGKDDAANVYDIQGRMHIATLSQYLAGETDNKEKGTYREEHNFIPAEYILGMSMEEYFTKANKLMEDNPPTAKDQALLQELSEIRVGPGLTFDASVFGDDAQDQWKQLVGNITQTCLEGSEKYVVKNGVWSYFGSPIAEFGTAYDYRALVALAGLGANPVSTAIYPKAMTDSDGDRLNGAQAYVLHFDADSIPKTKERGFWSVTAYNSSDNLLIDNEADRYCINDRSDVVYNADGSLDIYVQAQKPDAEKEKNWLPVAEEDFHLYLRVYFPEEEIVQNQWKMPVIRKGA